MNGARRLWRTTRSNPVLASHLALGAIHRRVWSVARRNLVGTYVMAVAVVVILLALVPR